MKSVQEQMAEQHQREFEAKYPSIHSVMGDSASCQKLVALAEEHARLEKVTLDVPFNSVSRYILNIRILQIQKRIDSIIFQFGKGDHN